MSETEGKAQEQKPKTSKLAIASILIPTIMTIGGLCFWTGGPAEPKGFWLTLIVSSTFAVLGSWPIGLILGIVSLVVIKKSGGLLKGRGFAIVGIVLSSFFIYAFTLFVAVLVLVAPKTPKSFICGTNLRGLGLAILIYANDNDDKYPTPDKWCDLLVECTDVPEKGFKCPGNKKERCSYAMNPNCGPNSPNDVVLLFETKGGWNQFGGPEILTIENHKGKGCNVLFNNGRVEFVTPERLGELKWEVEEVEE